MFKKNISFIIAIIFLLTLYPLTSPKKVFAYQNSSYFNDLKVGLVSMSSTSMTILLNGDYTLNGQVIHNGTVLTLKVSGTNIDINGAIFNQITLLPVISSNLLTITSGTISNKYMGAFSVKVINNKLLPINTIDIENYLKGVVGYEMSDYFPIEALKSQAVAARNYALSRIGYEAAKGYDFDSCGNLNL